MAEIAEIFIPQIISTQGDFCYFRYFCGTIKVL